MGAGDADRWAAAADGPWRVWPRLDRPSHCSRALARLSPLPASASFCHPHSLLLLAVSFSARDLPHGRAPLVRSRSARSSPRGRRNYNADCNEHAEVGAEAIDPQKALRYCAVLAQASAGVEGSCRSFQEGNCGQWMGSGHATLRRVDAGGRGVWIAESSLAPRPGLESCKPCSRRSCTLHAASKRGQQRRVVGRAARQRTHAPPHCCVAAALLVLPPLNASHAPPLPRTPPPPGQPRGHRRDQQPACLLPLLLRRRPPDGPPQRARQGRAGARHQRDVPLRLARVLDAADAVGDLGRHPTLLGGLHVAGGAGGSHPAV